MPQQPNARSTDFGRYRRWFFRHSTVPEALVLAMLLAPLGCEQAAPSKLDEAKSLTAATVGTETPAAEKSLGAGAKFLETWDAVFMKDTKVGSVHTVFESIKVDGQPMVRGSSIVTLQINRDGQVASMKTQVVAVETPQGALRSFRLETQLGPTPIITKGTVRDDQLQMVTTSRGQQTPSAIPWSDDRNGFFAMEQSLSEQPMNPGEKRELTLLMPGVAGIQLATCRMQAESLEETVLLDGSQELLRIAVTSEIGGQEIKSICWTSAKGDVLKTSHPILQQTIYRTTQKRAQEAGSGDYDLFQDSIVKVATPLPYHQLTRATYEVTLPGKDPSKAFACGESQSVQPDDDGTAQVTVLAVRPQSAVTGVTAPAPSPADSAPNSLIQSDDRQIIEMGRQIAGSTSDIWAKCLALEKGVHDAIDVKNFGQGFASAADVAQTLEGDCTEHAVLLAALCRAQKIPARVALGLVYSHRDQGFAFHMWNEAWVDDRWIPLDATLGKGGVGAAHVKLRHSSLAGEAAETAVLSVVQVINQLKIEVVDFQPR